MKKLLLLISVAFAGVTLATAQSVKEDVLKQKISKAELTTQDAKKNTKPAPWIALAEANFEATNAPVAKIFKGLDEPGLFLMLEKVTPVTETFKGKEYLKYSYPYMDVFIADGVVNFWQMKKTVNDGGYEKALDALKKAFALDNGEANKKKVEEVATKVYNAYKQVGDNFYMQQELPGAASAFGQAYDVTKMGLINVTDTTSGFNAGLIYTILNEYKQADKYLSAALADGLLKNGDTYYYLNLCYLGENKEADAKEMLLKGIKQYPTNTKLVEGLLSVYAKTGEDPNSIIPYVEEAIKQDPTNPELYAGLGRVYDKLGNSEKSMESFNKALSLAPEDFGTNFNIGLIIIKQGDAANAILKEKPFTSTKAFNEDVSKVNGIYARALPMLEKAHSLNPKDASTVELLKNLYFRLRDESDQMMGKYNEYNELLKTMQE